MDSSHISGKKKPKIDFAPLNDWVSALGKTQYGMPLTMESHVAHPDMAVFEEHITGDSGFVRGSFWHIPNCLYGLIFYFPEGL